MYGFLNSKIQSSGLFEHCTSHRAAVMRAQGKAPFREKQTSKYNKASRSKGLYFVTEARPRLKKLRGMMYTVSYERTAGAQSPIRKVMKAVGA